MEHLPTSASSMELHCAICIFMREVFEYATDLWRYGLQELDKYDGCYLIIFWSKFGAMVHEVKVQPIFKIYLMILYTVCNLK